MGSQVGETVFPFSYGKGCGCRAHSQHRLFRWLYENPSASLVDAAKALGISWGNAKVISARLKRRSDYGRLCPLCFRSTFLRGSCQSCGFVAGVDTPQVAPDFDAMSPVHRILQGGGLGSELTVNDYTTITKLLYSKDKLPPALIRDHAKKLAQWARPHDDALLRGINLDLTNELKRLFPEDGVSDTAAKLAVQEVRTFRTRYPGLGTPHGLRAQVVEIVLARLRLLYPRGVTPLPSSEEGALETPAERNHEPLAKHTVILQTSNEPQ